MRSYRLDDRHVEPRERRGATRYPAIDNTSEVAWWVPDGLVRSAAQLMDVSREGLLVLVDAMPAGQGTVLVRMIQPEVTPWAEAVVVEARRTRHGPCLLRLSFCSTPPPQFLEQVSDCPDEWDD